MIQTLSKKTVLAASLVFMAIMFVVVMFYVNPLIDGNDGSGVLRLQLSFDKNAGIQVINAWGESGMVHFNRLFFMDYLYAGAYGIFLASLMSFLIMKKGKQGVLIYRFCVGLPFFAGLLDCMENTMEISFVKDPVNFSSALFFLHSVFAMVKWLAVFVAMVFIIILFFKRNVCLEPNQ